MSIIHRTGTRFALLAGSVALSATTLALAAPTAPAEASTGSWTCARTYSPTSGKVIGKACFNGTLAQVCDLSQDNRTVYGSFSTSAGPRSFSDSNGSASPCSYQRFAGIGSVSAYYR